MKNNEIVSKIVPDAVYDKGFKIGTNILPFFSFSKPEGEVNWSDEMAVQLEQQSKTHFIDRYNRKIALDQIRDKLAVKDSSYLDMGCSSGYMLDEVLDSYPDVEVIGADYISAGLLQCHQRLPDVPLFQVDLTHCQFNDNLFDAVTCLNVLEHIREDVTAIKQLSRILKPGGKLLITVPMDPGLYDIYDEVHQHVRRYKMSELKNKVKSAGLDVLAANHFGVFIYPAFYAIKQLNKQRYKQITEEQKKKTVMGQINSSSRLIFMEKMCNIEYFLSKGFKYPFGIRGYITAQKSKH